MPRKSSARRLLGAAALFCALTAKSLAGTLTDARITEFLASNDDGVEDELAALKAKLGG